MIPISPPRPADRDSQTTACSRCGWTTNNLQYTFPLLIRRDGHVSLEYLPGGPHIPVRWIHISPPLTFIPSAHSPGASGSRLRFLRLPWNGYASFRHTRGHSRKRPCHLSDSSLLESFILFWLGAWNASKTAFGLNPSAIPFLLTITLRLVI